MRPSNEEELQKREAIGTIRASRFVRKYAKSKEPINNIGIICDIHKEIFKDAWPEIAGAFRTENLEISHSKHKPPHYSKVHELMKLTSDELKIKINKLEPLQVQGMVLSGKDFSENDYDTLNVIVDLAAWIHHKIVHIHPFREGNGRTARLTANLILERYGLVGISIKIEKENKNKYRNALSQIDERDDYEPLKEMIVDGLVDRYEGIY